MSDIEQRLREQGAIEERLRLPISESMFVRRSDMMKALFAERSEAADTIASLRSKLEGLSRAAGTWEDGHRELLDAVMACCDPENRVCGLKPGPERDALEEVISRHHTVHSAKGPYIDAALAALRKADHA